MKENWPALLQESGVHAEFLQGLEYLRNKDWQAAGVSFRLAEQRLLQRQGEEHHHHNLYSSYLGFVLVMMNDLTGLGLCRRAALDELFHASVFANLARVELKLNHRRRAYEAVKRGLRVDPGYVGLRNIRMLMGVRREPVVAFLHRNHLLNRILGRLTYRSAQRSRPFRSGVV